MRYVDHAVDDRLLRLNVVGSKIKKLGAAMEAFNKPTHNERARAARKSAIERNIYVDTPTQMSPGEARVAAALASLPPGWTHDYHFSGGSWRIRYLGPSGEIARTPAEAQRKAAQGA